MKTRYSCCAFFNSDPYSYFLFISNDKTHKCIIAHEYDDFQRFLLALKIALNEHDFGSLPTDKKLEKLYNERQHEYDIPGVEFLIASGDTINLYLPMLPFEEKERWLSIIGRVGTLNVGRLSLLPF